MAEFLKLSEKKEKSGWGVQGGEGGTVYPINKWPVTTVTLAGLNNKKLAEDLWSSVGNGESDEINDYNFAAAVSIAMGQSTKVVVGEKTYWFVKLSAAQAFETKMGDSDDQSKADKEYDSNGFAKKVSDVFNEIK